MEKIWDIFFDLCLEGIRHGSLGTAAVITGADNKVIARGRNQII